MNPVIDATIKGIELKRATDPNVFSPKGVDAGTLAMLSMVDFREGDKVLDLGCGYGVVGILVAKILTPESVIMTDADERAVELARANAKRNGVPDIAVYQSNGFRRFAETGFSLILSNPPYHTDFSVPKEFIEKGFNRLQLGGAMYMVTKRKEWYRNKLAAIFGGVQMREIDGYYVFRAEKRSGSYANRKREKRQTPRDGGRK